jgi:CBS domain-containing protein
MKASALFHRSVITCTDRDHLDTAASQLWRHNVGCLPVVGDDGRLVGMITDRDIAIAALLSGGALHSTTVSSVMAKEVMTCRADDEVEAIVEKMTARRLRRVPVTDDKGRLVGILSLNDIARAAIAHQLTPAGVAGVLAAAAVPRSLAVTAP